MEVPARITLTAYATKRWSSLLKNPAVKRYAIGGAGRPSFLGSLPNEVLIAIVVHENDIERYHQLYAVKICEQIVPT